MDKGLRTQDAGRTTQDKGRWTMYDSRPTIQRTMNDFANNSISRIKTRIRRKSKGEIGGKTGDFGENRGKSGENGGISGENHVNPPLRIDMTHLVGFRKGLPRPANQWTLGRPSADVHIEKRPAEVHQSRPNLCVLCGKKMLCAEPKNEKQNQFIPPPPDSQPQQLQELTTKKRQWTLGQNKPNFW